MSAYWVSIDGVSMADIAPHSAPTWETEAQGGCGAASLTVSPSRLAPHHLLQPGALLRIVCGSMPVYLGEVTEYDRSSGELHAAGLSTSLRRRLAITSAGAPSRNVGTVIAAAITRGWRGSNIRNVGVGVTVPGDADGNPITIGDLLDQWATEAGKRWGVDARGLLYSADLAPGTPRWVATPGAAAFGTTSEDTPTMLAGAYVDSTGVRKTAFAGVAGTEAAVDLTDRGILTLAQAQAILSGMLAGVGAVSWVNSVELTADEITTTGGVSAFLPAITAGDTLRAFGVGYIGTGAMTLDTVIGKTTHTAGTRIIQLEPVNTAPRTFSEVTAA